MTSTKYNVPSLSLIHLSTGYMDAEKFLTRGIESFSQVKLAIESVGHPIQPVDRILEWGCGCGRITRHALEQGLDVYGIDISEPAISWCRENLGVDRFSICSLMPPTVFPSDHFSFIYAGSVITHITLPGQFKWMKEIYRLLNLGGHVLLTFHGIFYFHRNHLKDDLTTGALNDSLFYERGVSEGSNAYGSIQTIGTLDDIFFPFRRELFIQRHGILGAQDTVIFRKRADIDLTSDGATHVAVLLVATSAISAFCTVQIVNSGATEKIRGGVVGQYFLVHFPTTNPTSIDALPEIVSVGGKFDVVDSVSYKRTPPS